MPGFVGRQTQLNSLDRLLGRIRSEINTDLPGRCILMRGRRRVGKSRLVEVFANRSGVPTLYFTASRQKSHELELFAEAVVESNLPNADLFRGTHLDNWDVALRLLGQTLPHDTPSIVIFDEFPYLVEQDVSIEAIFQKQWDRILSHKPVLLILVGSDLAMMEALNSHDRAFYQRGTEMIIPPLSPLETAQIVGSPDETSAFDSYLITGGLPLICDDWPVGLSMWDYLEGALSETTSALIVSAERSLAAEFPVEALAREVLGKIGAGETTFTNISRAAGGLQAVSASRALELLTAKRIVIREVPLSTKPSKEARYRVDDPYLRFWLTFIGPHLAEIERGRSDRVLARIKASWTSWRGRAIEPIVRESLARLLPLDGLAAEAVGGYWTRTNVPEVDIIGADRNPLAKVITFAGSIKWLETEPFDNGDLNALAAATLQVPGASKDTPLIAVSRSGVGPNVNAAFKFGPDDLIKAW
ncbi:MAG: ATP-binding protein [Actinomycetota bacterium]|jgi:AAA+ ATPase superfamily predicted ATPase|nr:ATP-binding protein [Actinomycetota bacterium]